jgi:hypothetical protein
MYYSITEQRKIITLELNEGIPEKEIIKRHAHRMGLPECDAHYFVDRVKEKWLADAPPLLKNRQKKRIPPLQQFSLWLSNLLNKQV